MRWRDEEQDRNMAEMLGDGGMRKRISSMGSVFGELLGEDVRMGVPQATSDEEPLRTLRCGGRVRSMVLSMLSETESISGRSVELLGQVGVFETEMNRRMLEGEYGESVEGVQRSGDVSGDSVVSEVDVGV